MVAKAMKAIETAWPPAAIGLAMGSRVALIDDGFEPATTRTLMAALLVYDLHAGDGAQPHPWHDEAHAAAHGGLWRIAYSPRSALGLATLLGYRAARHCPGASRPPRARAARRRCPRSAA